MVLAALITVKRFSERIPNKSFRPFADTNLLELKINQLKKVKRLDKIIVNSEDNMLLSMSKSLGVETVKRDPKLAQSTTLANEVYPVVARDADCDIVLSTMVTLPLISVSTYEKFIDSYFNLEKEYDSIISAYSIKEFFWYKNKPLNYDIDNKPKTQNLEPLKNVNSAINILPRKLMIERKTNIGFKPKIVEMPEIEAVDIDYPFQFYLAELLYKHINSLKIKSELMVKE